MVDTVDVVDAVTRAIESADVKLKVLNQSEVIQWIYHDLSFLPSKTKKDEDRWGLDLARRVVSKSNASKQWTNKVGELIVQDILRLRGIDATKCRPKDGLCPDLESQDVVYEVKTGTYLTSGTANEKLMAVPYKYVDVPTLYHKPLSIICVGKAELDARDKFGVLNGERLKSSERRQQVLNLYKTLGIEYYGATELLSDWCANS